MQVSCVTNIPHTVKGFCNFPAFSSSLIQVSCNGLLYKSFLQYSPTDNFLAIYYICKFSTLYSDIQVSCIILPYSVNLFSTILSYMYIRFLHYSLVKSFVNYTLLFKFPAFDDIYMFLVFYSHDLLIFRVHVSCTLLSHICINFLQCALYISFRYFIRSYTSFLHYTQYKVSCIILLYSTYIQASCITVCIHVASIVL
jgi:hypothetical protein